MSNLWVETKSSTCQEKQIVQKLNMCDVVWTKKTDSFVYLLKLYYKLEKIVSTFFSVFHNTISIHENTLFLLIGVKRVNKRKTLCEAKNEGSL